VPIEDVAGAVKDLIREGKVRHFGLACQASPLASRTTAHSRCSGNEASAWFGWYAQFPHTILIK